MTAASAALAQRGGGPTLTRRYGAAGPTLAALLVLGWTAGAEAGPAGIDQAELLRTIQARQIGADPATVVAVSLGTLEAKARCGRTLVVADGTAAGALTINAACTQAAPLVVRARETLGPVIRGQVTIVGDHVRLEGFRLDGGNIVVRGSSNRVTRNLVECPRAIGIQVEAGPRGGSYNQIDHNEVTGFALQGIEVCLGEFVAGPGAPAPVCTGGEAANARHNWIHSNHVHDVDTAFTGNGHEAIRILPDAYGDTSALIEGNLLAAVFARGEPEAISIKSNGNVVRRNTLDSARSEITLRQGNGNVVHSNYLVRGDIKVKGDRNEVYRNRLLEGSVKVDAGNGTMDDPRCATDAVPCTPAGKGAYAAARRSLVRDNLVADGTVVSGRRAAGFTVPAQRNTFLRNAPAVVRGFDDVGGTVVRDGSPVGVTTTRLTPGDVGPRS